MALIATLGRLHMTERPDDDAALVARLARGDADATQATERLYARFGRPLFAYALELTGDPTTAEEVVQDTFVAAWRGADRFERRSSVSTWLFGIARRQARDRLRRAAPPGRAPIEELETVADAGRTPEAHVLASATREELASALARLPIHHREPLVLAFVAELSGPEIAAVLGIPEGTVKSRLFAARRALRAALDPEDVR